MHILRLSVVLFATSAIVIGCQQNNQAVAQSTPKEATLSGDVVAVVNGVGIDEGLFNDFLAQTKERQPDGQSDRKAVLNEMITLELVKQQAVQTGLDKRKDVIVELERLRTTLLANTFLSERVESMSFTDEQLKKEYELQVAQLSRKEYKARHILSKTEDDATGIIVELDKGAEFAQLAKEKSTGPSGPQGGDLGWFSPNTMVPPFAKAVQSMPKGSFSKQPVQTQFGWHVILLEDTRELTPPSFDEIKNKLQNILATKTLRTYLEELRSKADIQINNAMF